MGLLNDIEVLRDRLVKAELLYTELENDVSMAEMYLKDVEKRLKGVPIKKKGKGRK